MSGLDIKSVKRFFLGKHCFYYKLLNPFPEQGFLSGVDSGVCALNIAMHYRHNKFRNPPAPMNIQSQTPGRIAPIQRQMLPKGGLILGIGTGDDFWVPEAICQAAKANNYLKSEVIQGLTFDNVKELIKNDHVSLVAFDVDSQGNPGTYGGANVHWAVIVGYGVFHDGSEYIIATHSWGGFYIWTLDQLAQSNIQLLNLPQADQSKAVVNGSTPVQANTTSISLNAVREKMIVIAA